MISISVHTNVEQLAARLDAVSRQQLPFAVAHALTMTAKRVQVEEQREMRQVFDRPTPYTLGSVYTKGATKATLEARVGLKTGSPAEKYLQAQIEGGQRQVKRFEKALQSVGALPPGYLAVPANGAILDAYGNMDRKQITQLLQYFAAFPEEGYRKNLTAARKARIAKGTKRKLGVSYFVGSPGNGRLPLGIWQRTHLGHGSAIKPIMWFVSTAAYEKRFDFFRIAADTVKRDFEPQLRASLAQALATVK